MAATQPVPENVRLRYGSASVFERADTHSRQVGELHAEDPLTVLGTDGDFYRVSLGDGSIGFVYAQNLVGDQMPLTANEQLNADTRAADVARASSGWRGALQRLRGGR